MADYHFHVQRVKRSAGKSVVAAAAYRAGEKPKDDYYGLTHDYSKKDIVKPGIFPHPRDAPIVGTGSDVGCIIDRLPESVFQSLTICVLI